MKATLLYVELPYPVELCEKMLDALLAKLPKGSRRTMHQAKSIAFMIPPGLYPHEIKVTCWSVLKPFKNWWMYGLSGETECMHGSMDPVEHFMDNYRVRPVARRKGPKPQHVPLTQRRQPRA